MKVKGRNEERKMYSIMSPPPHIHYISFVILSPPTFYCDGLPFTLQTTCQLSVDMGNHYMYRVMIGHNRPQPATTLTSLEKF